jgi:hypothetical protein
MQCDTQFGVPPRHQRTAPIACLFEVVDHAARRASLVVGGATTGATVIVAELLRDAVTGKLGERFARKIEQAIAQRLDLRDNALGALLRVRELRRGPGVRLLVRRLAARPVARCRRVCPI